MHARACTHTSGRGRATQRKKSRKTSTPSQKSLFKLRFQVSDMRPICDRYATSCDTDTRVHIPASFPCTRAHACKIPMYVCTYLRRGWGGEAAPVTVDVVDGGHEQEVFRVVRLFRMCSLRRTTRNTSCSFYSKRTHSIVRQHC